MNEICKNCTEAMFYSVLGKTTVVCSCKREYKNGKVIKG